jgi:hypothetical protein
MLAAELLELLQDLHGLAPELGVLAAEVLVGELARRVVELGVADLAVLGLLAKLEVGEPGVLFGLGNTLGEQWPQHERGHEGEEQSAEENLHRRTPGAP